MLFSPVMFAKIARAIMLLYLLIIFWAVQVQLRKYCAIVVGCMLCVSEMYFHCCNSYYLSSQYTQVYIRAQKDRVCLYTLSLYEVRIQSYSIISALRLLLRLHITYQFISLCTLPLLVSVKSVLRNKSHDLSQCSLPGCCWTRTQPRDYPPELKAVSM